MNDSAKKVKRPLLLVIAGAIGSVGLLFIEMGIAGLVRRQGAGSLVFLFAGAALLAPAIFLARAEKRQYRLSWLILPGFGLLFTGMILGLFEWAEGKHHPQYGNAGLTSLAVSLMAAGLAVIWPSRERRWATRALLVVLSLVTGFCLMFVLDPELRTYRAGWQKYNHGDYAGALEAFNECLLLRTNSATTFRARGVTRAALKNYEGAIADFTAAIRLDPNYERAYFDRGAARLILKNFDGAIADADEAMKLAPKDEWNYQLRGTAKTHTPDLDGAIADITESIRLNPKHAEAFSSRAYAKNLKGDHDGALADCAEALRLNPKFAKAYKNRAVAREAKGDHVGAVADCSAAIRLDPKLGEAFYVRGIARQSLGAVSESKLDLAEALRLGFVPPTKNEK
ncbi:MAG TPA: tetratricopeptide repeat protein [Verrucomicrobiae bacterium]|nr:tetratricopeptide repeat protein [Verrucomicrobiae bacterium]